MQYDEYDNAAHCMMAHSPVAWEHVTFKDVVIKVSNVDVYYKAIRFYLQVCCLIFFESLCAVLVYGCERLGKGVECGRLLQGHPLLPAGEKRQKGRSVVCDTCLWLGVKRAGVSNVEMTCSIGPSASTCR
jgi:uncharacterized CHY-type Zn-finger protein